MNCKRIVSAFFATALLGAVFGQAGWAKEDQPPEALESMVITATKTPYALEDVPVETVLITGKDIERSNAKTIEGLLGTIPGFNFSQAPDLTGTMNFRNTIRGLNIEDRRMLVLVDGQRVFGGYASGGMAFGGDAFNVNVVPLSLVDHIEVVKGPASALYGSEAVTGVINIITKVPEKQTKAAVAAGYGWYTMDGERNGRKVTETTRSTYNAFGTVQGAVTDTLSATLSFSHEAHEGIKEIGQTVFKNYIHTQLQLSASDNFTLKGGAELTAYEADGKDWVSWTSTWEDDTADELIPRFWLVGDYKINADHSLKLQGYFQRIDGDIVAAASTGAQDYDNRYGDVEIQYTGRFFDDHLFTSGIEYLRTSYEGNFVADSENTTLSLYAQDEWRLFDGALILIPGVRVDDNSDYGRQWSPKFNAMYTPLPGTKFRAGLGKTFKAPTPGQMSSERFWMVYMWAQGNPDLKPEEGFTWQVGLDQDLWDGRLNLGITYYNTELTDMIAEGLRDDGVYSYSNISEGEIQGVETTANIALWASYHLVLTYAYTDARDGQTGERLVCVPEHSFGAQLDYANKKYGFDAMLSVSHTTDQINGMSAGTTEDFTTVGCKLQKDIMENGRIILAMSNLFDQELRGSELFYPRQAIKAGIEFDF